MIVFRLQYTKQIQIVYKTISGYLTVVLLTYYYYTEL